MIATGIVALWNVAKCLSKSTQNDSDNCRSDKYKGIMRYTRYDIIDKANQDIEPWPIQIRIHSAYVLLTFPLRFSNSHRSCSMKACISKTRSALQQWVHRNHNLEACIKKKTCLTMFHDFLKKVLKIPCQGA